MVRDETSYHIVCKLLRKKGYTSFSVYNSKHQNEYGGWWIDESNEFPSDTNMFLGVTLKDALHTLLKTNQIPDITNENKK